MKSPGHFVPAAEKSACEPWRCTLRVVGCGRSARRRAPSHDTVRIENTKPLFTRAPQRAAVARRSGPQPGRARWSAVWTGAGRMGEGSASEVLGRRPREGRQSSPERCRAGDRRGSTPPLPRRRAQPPHATTSSGRRMPSLRATAGKRRRPFRTSSSWAVKLRFPKSAPGTRPT